MYQKASKNVSILAIALWRKTFWFTDYADYEYDEDEEEYEDYQEEEEEEE